MTRISIDVAGSSVLPLLFLRAFYHAVILLTYVVAIKLRSYYELVPWHIIHLLGFITLNFLPICLMIMAALAIFQAWVSVGVGIGKSFKNILAMKSTYSGCVLASGWLPVSLCSYNELNVIMG